MSQQAPAQGGGDKAKRTGKTGGAGGAAPSKGAAGASGGRMGHPSEVATLPDDIIHQIVKLFGGARGPPLVEDVWLTATRPIHHLDDDVANAAGAAAPGGKRRNAVVEDLRSSQQPTNEDEKRATSPFVNKKGEGAIANVQEDGSSVVAGGGDIRKVKITIWPEFNEADINAEKWELVHKTNTKEKEKGKSPVGHNLFEDPEGRPEMPPSLRAALWKRPVDVSVDKTPVVVDPEYFTKFDLITPNKHILQSEVIRFIISQINALWQIRQTRNPLPANGENDPNWEEVVYGWKPWEHIFAINKIAKEKGPYLPVYNSFGKYVIRLFWMGCWRKLIIDDQLPFDDKDQMLLPATSNPHELWPMLLTKGILKILSLDLDGSDGNLELGDNSVIHMLTGWLPELVPLHTTISPDIWAMLKQFLPEFKLPTTTNANASTSPEHPNVDLQASAGAQDLGAASIPGKPQAAEPRGKLDTATGKARPEKSDKPTKTETKTKDSKPSKDKDKAKSEEVLPENREVVVFAYYTSYPKGTLPVGMLRKMAEESESLRQKGLSQLGTHMVWLKQVRACPLEPPPPPEVVPAWKMVRPRKPRIVPADLVDERGNSVEDPNKPIQCIEMASPYIGSPFWTYEQEKLEMERHAAKFMIAEEVDDGDGEPQLQQVTQQQSLPQPAVPEPTPPPPVQIVQSEATVVSQSESKSKPLAPQLSKGSRQPSTTSLDKRHSQTNQQDAGKLNPVPSQFLQDTASSVPPGGNSSAQPPQNQPGEEGEGTEVPVEPTLAEQMRTAWFDFDDFMTCFKYIVVFHKTNTYPHVKTFTDVKGQVVSRDRRISSSALTQGLQSEDKAVYYLTVDSLEPIELVFCVSCICRWPELTGQQTARPRDNESISETMSMSGGQSAELMPTGNAQPAFNGTGELLVERHSWKSLASGSTILRLHTNTIRATALILPAGRHVLRLVVGAPLAYHLTVSSMAAFALGEEDFVMQNLTKESLRYTDAAIRVITNFITCLSTFGKKPAYSQAYGEMVRLAVPTDIRVSRRRAINNFVTSLAVATKSALGESATAEMAFAWRVFFQDPNAPSVVGSGTVSRPGTSIGTAPGGTKRTSATVKEKEGQQQQPTKEKSEHGKEKSNVEKGAGKGKKDDAEGGKGKKEASGLQSQTPAAGTGPYGLPANYIFADRDPTPEELASIVKLQKCQRGAAARKVFRANKPGTTASEKAAAALLKMAELLQPHIPTMASTLFRTMFGEDPELLRFYPFFDDEWNRIVYCDYNGSYPEQLPNTWFLLFRDIFHVKQNNLVVPRLTCSLAPAFLRVIDNDTGEEIERVFCRVTPHTFTPNKRGYTILGEARSSETANAVSGRWRMRLIGSHTVLPQPNHNDLVSSFCTRELRDYYVPNDRNVICRYSVKVNSQHMTTIYASTSDPNAEFYLQIFDKDRVVQSTRGRGAILIPAFIFVPDVELPQDATEDASQQPATASATTHPTPTKSVGGKTSSNLTGRPTSRSGVTPGRSPSPKTRSSRPGSRTTSPGPEPITHRWIVQCTLLTKHSWPVGHELEPWFEQQRDQAKQETKLSYDSEPGHGTTSIKVEMTPRAGGGGNEKSGLQSASGTMTAKDTKNAKESKTGGGKGVSKGKDKDKDKDDKRESKTVASRSPSVGFDEQKPFSTVKIISDYSAADDIEVFRDTSRADEIRAMKRAWEEAEPGRAAKARQSRLNYLRSCGVPVDDLLVGVGGATAPADAVDKALSKVSLPDKDFSPFLRCWKDLTNEERRSLDPATRPQVIAEFTAAERDALAFLETDKQIRQFLKKQQLEEYEKIQVETDRSWAQLVSQREAIRTRLLEEERLRQEAAAAALAEQMALDQAKQAELAAANAKGKGKGKGSPKAKKKK